MASCSGVRVTGPCASAFPLAKRATVCARAGTSEYRPRVGGGGDKENDLPAYQEVRVERFGWRRRSFISRQNSVLLAR